MPEGQEVRSSRCGAPASVRRSSIRRVPVIDFQTSAKYSGHAEVTPHVVAKASPGLNHVIGIFVKAQAKPNWMTGQPATFNTMIHTVGSSMSTNLPSFPDNRLHLLSRGDQRVMANQARQSQSQRSPHSRRTARAPRWRTAHCSHRAHRNRRAKPVSQRRAISHRASSQVRSPRL